MRHRPLRNRLVKAALAVAVAGTGLLAFGAAANADSLISKVEPGACIGGTANRAVTVSYTTNASFTTGVRIHVVSGTPGGSIIDTITREFQGPASITIPLALPAGTYYFDWEDRSGDGVTWSGRHSGISSFYNGIYLSTKTDVALCAVEIPATTTTTTTTTTTVIPLVPGTASTVATTVATVPPPATTAPTTTIAAAPPTALASTTTAASKLPATGSNSGPLVLAGTLFLIGGCGAVVVSRRQPRTQS